MKTILCLQTYLPVVITSMALTLTTCSHKIESTNDIAADTANIVNSENDSALAEAGYKNALLQQTIDMQKMIRKRDSVEIEKEREAERLEREREEQRKNERMKNDLYSTRSTRSSSQNYSDRDYTVFHSAWDVITYTISNKFISPDDGSEVVIREEALYVNGQPISGAPEVISFYGSTAIIRVYSPYSGGSALTIRVDASRGTLTDGSGDVYYKK